jgi:hypothetical protein
MHNSRKCNQGVLAGLLVHGNRTHPMNWSVPPKKNLLFRFLHFCYQKANDKPQGEQNQDEKYLGHHNVPEKNMQ